jgi:hypothetical protein
MERRLFLKLLAALGAATSIPAPREDDAGTDTLQPPTISDHRYLLGMTVVTEQPALVSVFSGETLVHCMSTPLAGIGVSQNVLALLGVPKVPAGVLTLRCECPAIAKLTLVPGDTPLTGSAFALASHESLLVTTG